MNDLKSIEYLKKICEFTFTINENYCIEISFYNENYAFEGTLRKLSNKSHIIEIVSKFPFLKKLNLRKCKLGKLPDFVSKDFEYLDLSCNDLESVPNWILNQPNLKFLNLGANKLKELPIFEHLPLETLKLHKNLLTKEPLVHNGLKSLNLYLNPLSCFPNSILDFHQLEVFSLGVTNLDQIPQISSLSNLRFLTLTVNNFKELPKDISRLQNLELLVLAKNKLESLPLDIGLMKSLRALTLYENNLSELPESFFELNLSKLNLLGNNLNHYKDILNRTFGNIDFLRA